MKTKRLTFLLIVLLCVSLPVGNVTARVLQTIDWSVIGGGGEIGRASCRERV